MVVPGRMELFALAFHLFLHAPGIFSSLQLAQVQWRKQVPRFSVYVAVPSSIAKRAGLP